MEKGAQFESPEYQLFCEQWQALSQTDVTVAKLQAFYARYKYLIMSRSVTAYREIGTLLATATRHDLPLVMPRMFEMIRRALAIPPTPGGNVNALLHISGYLKKQLSTEERQILHETIARYGRGEIELGVPLAMLRTHFQRFPNPYIEQQLFLTMP